ncbi:MAG: hypothetical protein AAGA18_14410 [Verrucomicrobiota bacterium]
MTEGQAEKIELRSQDGVTYSVLDSYLDQYSWSLFAEFDHRRKKFYPLDVQAKVRKTVTLSKEVISAAEQRGLRLSEYVQELHVLQRSTRVAYAATIFRSFALLEMARVPVEPAYTELVHGVMGSEDGEAFQKIIASGIDDALIIASAKLLGADIRASAVEAVLQSAKRANVMHEGFLEASRLLESTFYR